MLGIERTITENTHQFRRLELDASKPFLLLIVAVNVLNAAATSIAPAATIILDTATRMNIRTEIPSPEAIFTSLSLISLLTSSVTLLYITLTKFTSGMSSFDRIQEYLLAGAERDEALCQSTEVASEPATELTTMPGIELVGVQSGSFRYGIGECQLNDLTFAVNLSEVVAITGPLGRGKSTLLKAVLGEISCVKGQVSVQAASVAYSQQRPFIFNGTIGTAAKSRSSGDVTLYAYYIDPIGRLPFLFVLVFDILYVTSLVFPQILLSWWSSSVPRKGVTYFVTYTVCNYFFVWAVPKSAIKLHRLLLDVVMHMPWVQLVRVRIGNLIKRFSQDMSLVDMQLPVAFGVTLQTFLTCIAKGVMIVIGSGYMSVRTSRQIRLLDLEAKAPLYDHFLQTIDGGATNRAFQWQERFTKMNEELLGLSQKSFYALYSAQQWLQVVLDLLVAALATLLTALVLFATSKSTSGSVGVAPVNLLSFKTTLAQLINNWMQLETSLGAISRTKEFVTNPDHQPPKAAQDNRVDKSCWQRRPNFEASLHPTAM
ncbi:hypothetical protein MY3296_005672 [Beauveria thailandica]